MTKLCPQCGVVFHKKSYEGRPYWSRKKFCSIRCGTTHNAPINIAKMIAAIIGKPSWNKGISPPPEIKIKYNANRRGKPYSSSQRQKLEMRMRLIYGENWKPLVTKSIKDSILYSQWRSQILARDKYCCIMCGYKSHTKIQGKSDLQVDHIVPFSIICRTHKIETLSQAQNCAELWDISNGRTLCIPCHKNTITYGHNVHSLINLQT